MKFKVVFSTLIVLLIGVVRVCAQDILPCGGEDPDATCPLDTWVIVLVVAAGIFTTYRLYRRQTASLPQGSRS